MLLHAFESIQFYFVTFDLGQVCQLLSKFNLMHTSGREKENIQSCLDFAVFWPQLPHHSVLVPGLGQWQCKLQLRLH